MFLHEVSCVFSRHQSQISSSRVKCDIYVNWIMLWVLNRGSHCKKIFHVLFFHKVYGPMTRELHICFNGKFLQKWSSGLSHMFGILILRYSNYKYEIPFISFCFLLDKLCYIFETVSLMWFNFQENKALWVL